MVFTIDDYEGAGRSLSLKLIQLREILVPLSQKSLRLQMMHMSRPLRKKLFMELSLRCTRPERSNSRLPFGARPGIKSRNGSSHSSVSMPWSCISLCTKAAHILPHASCSTSVEVHYTAYRPASEVFLQRIKILYVAGHYQMTSNSCQMPQRVTPSFSSRY